LHDVFPSLIVTIPFKGIALVEAGVLRYRPG